MSLRELPVRARHLMAALAIVLTIVALAPASRASGYFGDFNAFYCAGSALTAGKDPYLAEPIGSCERRPRPQWVRGVAHNLILPAPLPPYALAPFMLLSRLPLVAAAVLWSATLFAAFCITLWSLRRATGLPATTLFAIFAIPAYAEMYYGEIPAIAVAAIAVSVLLLEQRKGRAAALAASVALIEPHLGLPAVLALFVCVPETRTLLAGVGAGLFGVCLAVAGPKVTLEYVHTVLPLHALSEVANSRQLSLTSVVHLLGAPDRIAVRAGSLCYGTMLAIGVIVAYRFKQASRYDGLIVAAPVALVLLGGVFIHVTQMEAALPAALIGFTKSAGKLKTAFGAATILLAIPWVLFTDLGLIFAVLVLLAVAFLMRHMVEWSPRASGATALVAAAFTLALIYGLVLDPNAPSTIVPTARPGDFAEVNWTLHVALNGKRNYLTFFFARVPTWCGIALLVGALCSVAARPAGRLANVPKLMHAAAARVVERMA